MSSITFDPNSNPKYKFALKPDKEKRSSAIVTSEIAKGEVIISVKPLATVLFPQEKAQRCDFCLREDKWGRGLKRCSGCHYYYYCGKLCHSGAWKAGHNRLCAVIPGFVKSMGTWSGLNASQQLESLLLTHLAAEHLHPKAETLPSIRTAHLVNPLKASTKPIEILFGLAPHPKKRLPPVPISYPLPVPLLQHISARSQNNHFTIHDAYLKGIANGMFPLASRCFNHTCVPNAAVTYSFAEGEQVRMNVRAIRDLVVGDEITLTYVDPAIDYVSRQDMLLDHYGFRCACPRCSFQKKALLEVKPSETDEKSATEMRAFELDLIDTVLYQEKIGDDDQRWATLNKYPSMIALEESITYLPSQTAIFSEAKHDRDADVDEALHTGLVILALYRIIYPFYYPLTGLHYLELTKVAWNAYLKTNSEELFDNVKVWIECAKEILRVSAPLRPKGKSKEDIKVGPMDELETMDELIEEEDELLRN